MTEKENLLRLINHQIPVWIPYSFTAYASGTSSLVNNQGIPGKGGKDWFGVNWLVEDASGTGAIHDPNQHLVEDITKWRDIITFPDLDAMDWEGAAAKDLANIDRNEHLITTDVMDGNFNRLQSLMGTCEALMALLDEPEAVMDFFEEHTKFKIRLIEKYAKYYKIDVLVNGDDICSATGLMFSHQIYEEMILPFQKRIAQAAIDNGMIVEHHVCGNCEDLIPDIIEMGAKLIQPMSTQLGSNGKRINDIPKLKKLYGDKIIFNGGWDSYGPHSTLEATEEMVRAEVRRVIDEYAYDGKFIIFGGNLLPTSVPQEIRNERMRWVPDECKNYSMKYIRENLKK